MAKALRVIGILFVVGAIAWGTVLYTVDQTEVAIVLRLGKPLGGPRGPGLHFRIPLVESVIKYDARQLEYDAEAREIISKDKKNIKVDNYARWRIVDPLKFYQTVRDEIGAQSRLDDIIYSQVREQLGKFTLLEIVATERSAIMAEVTRQTAKSAAEFGIEVVDVRIKRADLPPANEKAVYARMKAERTRQARKYRAEGEEVARQVRSQADKEKAILLAEAYRKSQEIRGEGDAEATRVYAEAYGKDTEFYDFVRSLEVYRSAIKAGDILLLSPGSELFRYLEPSRYLEAAPAR